MSATRTVVHDLACTTGARWGCIDMSDDQNPQAASPDSAGPDSSPQAPPPSTSPTVSRAMLLWVGVAVVVLSFFAAFLGSWLARSVDTTEAVPTPTPTVEEIDEAAYEEALEEILPAGSAVRAGTGVPEAGKGYEGDVYIDISNADVYLFQDGEWTLFGPPSTPAPAPTEAPAEG